MKNFLMSTEQIIDKVNEINLLLLKIDGCGNKKRIVEITKKYLKELLSFYDRELEKRNGNIKITSSVVLSRFNFVLKRNLSEIGNCTKYAFKEFDGYLDFHTVDIITIYLTKLWDIYVSELNGRNIMLG